MLKVFFVAAAAVLLPFAVGLTITIVANYQQYPPPGRIYVLTWLLWALGLLLLVEATDKNT